MVDWTKAPASGRRNTLIEALQRLHAFRPGGYIVEIGTSRNTDERALKGDGWGTRMFGWYASLTGGQVLTIDPSTRAIQNSQKICRSYANWIEFRRDRSERVLKGATGIDLLYIDGPSQTDVHIDTWRALGEKPPLVLIDDVQSWPPDETWTGGPQLAHVIETLLGEGYRIVFARDRQMLLEHGA